MSYLMPYLFLFLSIFPVSLLLTGCSESLEDYPNLADVGERPSKPSIQQLNNQRAELLKIQQQIQKEKETHPL